MYKFSKIRHDIFKQCHGNYKEMEKFNYKLEIEIFGNSTLKDLGVLSRLLASRVSGCLFGTLVHKKCLFWGGKDTLSLGQNFF